MKEESKNKYEGKIFKWIFTRWYFWTIMLSFDIYLLRAGYDSVYYLIITTIFEIEFLICFVIGRFIYIKINKIIKNNERKK